MKQDKKLSVLFFIFFILTFVLYFLLRGGDNLGKWEWERRQLAYAGNCTVQKTRCDAIDFDNERKKPS
jgi:hypothetical protein